MLIEIKKKQKHREQKNPPKGIYYVVTSPRLHLSLQMVSYVIVIIGDHNSYVKLSYFVLTKNITVHGYNSSLTNSISSIQVSATPIST